MPELNSSPGLLDGTALLRFAHAYDTGGGTERYLDDLDGALTERNRVTVVRIYLTREHSTPVVREETGRRGKLIRIRLPVIPAASATAPVAEQRPPSVRELLRNWVLYNPVVWRTFGQRKMASYRLHPRPGQAVGAARAVDAVLREHPLSLAVLHYVGGADAEEVVARCREAHVPIAVVNHYANDRFLHLAVRKHVAAAAAVAGVNGRQVPRYLAKRFVNLADGIDTEFFRREHARPVPHPPQTPLILLPARVVREKGQLDLIQAVTRLRRQGLPCTIAFAGRADTSPFLTELKSAIAAGGLESAVRFLGVLGLEDLRDWYAASRVVALPTYHDEGLPRILLESHAMGVPVVAYATGGVADGIASGRNGILLRTGDVDGLTESLAGLLTSPARAAELGRHGRAEAEKRFSLRALAERHEHLYRQVMDLHPTLRAAR